MPDISMATDASADELWDRWQELADLTAQAGDRMTETGQRWKDTTDDADKERLWVEYEVQARDFRVLVSWKDVFYAAYVFATDGPYCPALFDSSTPS